MGTFWQNSGTFEFDNNGERAIGAEAYFYDAGTSTPRTTYQDAILDTDHAHPVEADGNGRWPAVYLQYGSYKLVIKTAGGATLFTADNIPNPEPVEPDAGLTADSVHVLQTGQILLALANEVFTGFVRCNGRTIGSAASSASERANADTEDLYTYLWNKSTTLRAAMAAGAGASAAADFAANKTFPLPDGRAAGLIGFDDMGNSAASLLGSAPVVSGSGILAGSILGANTHAITEAQLATHTHAITAQATGAGTAHSHGLGTLATVASGGHTPTFNDPGHTHEFTFSQLNYTLSGTAAVNDIAQSGLTHTKSTQSKTTGITMNAVADHTHTFSGALATESLHTHSLTGVTDSKGSGTAHNILSRSIPVTVLMKL